MAPRTRPLPFESPDASLLERVRGTVESAAAALDRAIKRVSSDLDASEEYDDKKASHLAWVSQKLVGMLSELRKLEAHNRQTVTKLSPDERDHLVRAYLEALPPDRRDAFVLFLRGLTEQSTGVL